MSKSNMFPGFDSNESTPDFRSLDNDSKRISDNADSIQSRVYASKMLARFFELEVTLKIFGQVVWHWVFPPQN